ncbi:MAG TPA: siderophore-interacting protein [Streptosporangiaceae bacterium]|nr:siderophore-interacting protein [Streptosporangiaceae bacterium]
MTAPTSPARPRRIGGRVLTAISVTGEVTAIEPVAENLRRVRIEGDEVARLTWTPGQQVRVHVSDLLDPHNWRRPRDILRTYSIWRYDGGLELCLLDHDTGGPGARWARELRTGQPVTFGRPEGSFVLTSEAPYHVLAGEETAAVAFGAMLAALPAGTPAYSLIEVAGPGDRLPLARDVSWLYRDGRSAVASAGLLEAARRLELPNEPGAAYLAGEARTVQLLRRHFVSERGWPRQAVRTKPFWAPGKRGLD